MRLAALLLVTAACADPVVEMELVLPKTDAMMNPSCISAVEVRANGANFPAVQTDQIKSCIEISAGTTYASVRDAIHGKFSLGVPDSGLASVEIYGMSGVGACVERVQGQTYGPNLLFFGNADYIGQDTLQLPIVPNLDCATERVSVHMFDMMALANGATCAAATPAGTDNSVGLGTLTPKLNEKGIEIYGNIDYGQSVNSVASFDAHTHVGTKGGCLAADGGGTTGGSIGCVIPGPGVCAAAGEIEVPYLPNSTFDAIAALDDATTAKFPGATIVTVWSPNKTPIQGATVDFDKTHAKVTYVDPPTAQLPSFRVRTDNATGPSGMFILYYDTLVAAKVTAAGTTRTVTLGTLDGDVGGAMIVMQ